MSSSHICKLFSTASFINYRPSVKMEAHLKRIHHLVTLLEAEEVRDVVGHIRKVDVRDAELPRSRFRHAHLRERSFSLACRTRLINRSFFNNMALYLPASKSLGLDKFGRHFAISIKIKNRI